jgi:putative NADH-flavin reductase
VVEGDLKNTDLVCRAVAGKQAVISALGVSKPLQHDPELVEGIRNMVKAMAKEAVPRLIYQSVFLADARPGEFSFFARNILKRIIRKEVEDHQVKENLVREMLKDYTFVRPVRLTNGPFTGKFHHGVTITSRAFIPSIARADVAHFMLQQLVDTTYRNKAVRLMKTRIETN